MRILYVISALGPGGASKQLEMLALSLHHQGHHVSVCQLGAATPLSARLEQVGITVHSLGWTRPLDPGPLWRLHGILRETGPNMIHVWGATALRIVALAGRKWLGRVVLSHPFAWSGRQPTSALDRWLFSKVARIIVQGYAEASLGRTQGLKVEKLTLVWPGVAPEGRTSTTSGEWLGWPRTVVCVGPLERHKGFRNAVWAFDILRFIFQDLHLVLVGAGPDEGNLRQLAHNLRRTHDTHFLPWSAAMGCLARADVCWVPSVRGGGSHALLEAMMAGRPIVATQVPSLDGLIVDGQSGFCTPPGDKVGMARRTRQILLDPALAQQLGAQARQRALQHFPAKAFVESCQRIYMQTAC